MDLKGPLPDFAGACPNLRVQGRCQLEAVWTARGNIQLCSQGWICTVRLRGWGPDCHSTNSVLAITFPKANRIATTSRLRCFLSLEASVWLLETQKFAKSGWPVRFCQRRMLILLETVILGILLRTMVGLHCFFHPYFGLVLGWTYHIHMGQNYSSPQGFPPSWNNLSRQNLPQTKLWQVSNLGFFKDSWKNTLQAALDLVRSANSLKNISSVMQGGYK